MEVRTTDPVAETAAAAVVAPLAVAPALLALADAIAAERVRAGRALFGVGATEFAALEWLAGGERTPTELADRLHLTTASVTGLVDRLAADGLVDRRPHPSDRRKVLVTVTATTRDRLTEWGARLEATVRRATSGLGPHQVEDVLGTVGRLTTALTTAAAPRDRTALTETLDRITAATDAFTRPARRP